MYQTALVTVCSTFLLTAEYRCETPEPSVGYSGGPTDIVLRCPLTDAREVEIENILGPDEWAEIIEQIINSRS